MSETPTTNGIPDAMRPAHPKAFFDAYTVDRPVPERPWAMLALVAALATAVLTAGWEFYWRANWHEAGDFKNTPGLWAQQRRLATGDATVILGSSRIFFDTDLDVWEETSGRGRPIMLALEGTTPQPFLADLADDEKFHGLVIVDITVPLFFTGYSFRGDILDYAKNESPSQRIDQLLSMQLEKVLAFIDEQTRPKRMWFLTELPLRPGMEPRIDVRKLEHLDADRNTRLWRRVMEDEAYLKLCRDVWIGFLKQQAPKPGPNGEPPPPMPDEPIMKIIAETKASIDKIRARGGEVVFTRYPYTGPWAAAEDGGFPRERFWDRLIAETGAVGIAFQDYPELQGYYLPEWSHLSPEESVRFTRAIVPILYRELDERKKARL
jgi:hypothetical protein